MSSVTEQADIVIVGAGLVGASVARAFSLRGKRVMVIDAKDYQALPTHAPQPLSLTYASYQSLQTLGVWEAISAFATPVEQVHVSDKGHAGIVRLHANDVALPMLGYVVDIAALHNVLYARLTASDLITLRAPIALTQIERHAEGVRVTAGDHVIDARLLIAADGQQSFVRRALGISFHEETTHSVMIAQYAAKHHNTAYERFTPEGTIAMLPMQGDRVGMAWSGEHLEKFMLHSDDVFLQTVQAMFGYRLGRLRPLTPRRCVSVCAGMATEISKPHVVLLGNASQTLLPIAAQGFNLGLRQAMRLTESVCAGEPLETYAMWQRDDQARMMRYTQTLAGMFSTTFFPVVAARNLGLTLLESCGMAKRAFTRVAIGVNR